MLPFDSRLIAGKPVTEQVLAAISRAIATGRLKPGDPFPSVRELSRELGVNPNTAHKIIMHLTEAGDLEVRPGLGTRVTERKATPASRRARDLAPAAADLALLAKRLGADREELEHILRREWDKIDPSESR